MSMTFCFETDIRNNYISLVFVKSEINTFQNYLVVVTDCFPIGTSCKPSCKLLMFQRSRLATLSFVKFPMFIFEAPLAR